MVHFLFKQGPEILIGSKILVVLEASNAKNIKEKGTKTDTNRTIFSLRTRI